MAKLNFGNMHFVRGMAYAADLFAGTVYTDVISAKNHHQIAFIINQELGSTGTTVVTAQACDDVVPTTRSAIPFHVQKYLAASDIPAAVVSVAAAGFTTTAEATAAIYVVIVDVAELAASGYGYVQLKFVEGTNDPVAGSVIVALDQPRYNDEVTPTVIA